MEPPLLVHVSLDHLRRHVRRPRSPAAVLPQNHDHDVGIPPRRHPHEPCIRPRRQHRSTILFMPALWLTTCAVPVFPAKSMPSRCEAQAVPPGPVTAAMPSVMISQLAGLMGTVTSPAPGKESYIALRYSAGRLVGKNHVRALQGASGSDPAEGPRQLNRRSRYRALPDARRRWSRPHTISRESSSSSTLRREPCRSPRREDRCRFFCPGPAHGRTWQSSRCPVSAPACNKTCRTTWESRSRWSPFHAAASQAKKCP